jgi:branched-subunit amino acid ABC-type transport system permease component
MDYALDLLLLTLIGVAVLVLISLGLAVMFGMMRVINLAHGEFLMLGAVGTVILDEHGVPLTLSMIIAGLLVGAVGVVVERLVVRFLYGRIEYTLLATFGLSLIITQVVALTYGDLPRSVGIPFGALHIGHYAVATYQLVLVPVAAALALGVYLVFRFTRYGLTARAATENPAMAASLGINPARTNTTTFAFGALLAGFAGALLTPLVAVVPTLGVDYVARAFMTVVVGGAGVVTGTVAASGALGVVESLVSQWTTPVVGAGALLLGAIVLLRFLPHGISGRLGRLL